MKSKLLIAMLLTLGMSVAACAPATEETPTSVGTPLIPQTGATATGTVTETEPTTTEAPTETRAATETKAPAETPTVVTGPEATVKVSNKGTAPFLVDDRGRSLYVYMNDSPNTSTSACMDDCAVDWLPLVLTGTPAAGDGVDITLLGTLARDDGSKQVTYNGWPLYYSNLDTIPGSTNGQSNNGVWFLISPTGDPIKR